MSVTSNWPDSCLVYLKHVELRYTKIWLGFFYFSHVIITRKMLEIKFCKSQGSNLMTRSLNLKWSSNKN